MTRHVEVETSPDVKEAIPALAELVSVLGDPAVRNRGTLGGSLAGNDPSTDWPAAALGLGAVVTTNKRKIHADEFFKGLFETALEEGEIITKVSFPIPQKAGYKKFRHPASRYALVGVFVAKRSGEIRVAVTGAGANGVFRWAEAEAALAKRFVPQSLEGLAASPGRAEQRHPRRCRIPRPSHRRHGPPRRQGRRRAVVGDPSPFRGGRTRMRRHPSRAGSMARSAI